MIYSEYDNIIPLRYLICSQSRTLVYNTFYTYNSRVYQLIVSTEHSGFIYYCPTQQHTSTSFSLKSNAMLSSSSMDGFHWLGFNFRISNHSA